MAKKFLDLTGLQVFLDNIKGLIPHFTPGDNVTITTPDPTKPNEFVVSSETPDNFTGATDSTPGEAGLVPAPTIADKDKFLKASGEWTEVPSALELVQGDNITLTPDPTTPNKITVSSQQIDVDDELSETSENPVQNKVIYGELDALATDLETLNNKYETYFDKITVTGSSLKIGSSTAASISGTTLSINETIGG